jgi:hypothetical protein
MSESAAVPTPHAPSKRRVFASRLFSTLILWAVIALAFQWKSSWLVIAITGFFGVAGAVEYYRLLRSDPQARSFNALGFIASPRDACAHILLTCLDVWLMRVQLNLESEIIYLHLRVP